MSDVTCSACGRPVTADAGSCSGPHTNAGAVPGDPWWEARVVVHVQAPTREAADDVISSLFDRDEVMGVVHGDGSGHALPPFNSPEKWDRGAAGTGEGGGDHLEGDPPPELRCDGLDTGCTGTPDCPVHMGDS